MIALLLSGWPAFGESFALRETLPSEVRHPLGFSWARADTVAEWVVDWITAGEDVTWTARLCTVATPARFGAELTYSENFVQGVPPRVRRGRLAVDGAFDSGPLSEVIGDNDADGDGQPGVSITIRHPRVGKGDIYVRQTATLHYRGQRTADRIRGEVDYESEQEVLGATTWWLKIPVRQRKSEPGSFEMIPIDASTCGAVAEVW